MRIYLNCMTCFTESGKPPDQIVSAQLEDAGFYRMTCPAGHETVTYVQQMKFEVLFDLGLYALVDGYTREAVNSISSAVERFFEFYIQVRCRAAGMSAADFEALWKKVNAQSERQLGAYLFVHALTTRQVPPALAQKDVEFRNAVVHRGKIPSRAEALDYAKKAFEVVRQALGDLRRDAANEIETVTREYFFDLVEKQGPGSTMCFGTLVSLVRVGNETVDDWVAMLDGQRARRQASF